MIHQQDPVGLVTFDTKLTHGHAAQEQADAARHDPVGAGEPQADRRRPTSPDSLFQLASMIKGKSLVMLFSDLLPTTDDWKAEADAMIRSLYRLRHAGHEVILFHILDEPEVKFPFAGLVEFEDVESDGHKEIDAQGIARRLPARSWTSSARTTSASAPTRTSITCRWTRASASTRRCWST